MEANEIQKAGELAKEKKKKKQNGMPTSQYILSHLICDTCQFANVCIRRQLNYRNSVCSYCDKYAMTAP